MADETKKGFEGSSMLVDKHVSKTLKKADKQVYEIVEPFQRLHQSSEEFHAGVFGALQGFDREVYDLIRREYDRQKNTLQLIAAENQCSQAVLAALGSVVQNKTTEGFAGARFHGGCEVVDTLERLAIERAKETFGAKYANVQAHSGTSANLIVITAVLHSGDRILSFGLDQGGHVSHGARLSFAGKFFETEHYCVDPVTYLLDYEDIREKALEFRPNLIICGASAYSRVIDFEMFRRIANEVGAYLMADISHISGLVIAGVHPSPIDWAHFTTTSTYKPGGPRGGLILMGKDYEQPITVGKRAMPMWEHIDKMTFPGMQGTPHLNNIAAKAVFFKETLSQEYKARQFRIVENAKRLAKELTHLDYDVLTGGTDNHLLLVDVTSFRDGLTGAIAQRSLEDCGIIINMNRLPYEKRSAFVTSGMRLGTPIVTKNGMGQDEMELITQMVDRVLRRVEILGEREYVLDAGFKTEMREKVRELCAKFPMC